MRHTILRVGLLLLAATLMAPEASSQRGGVRGGAYGRGGGYGSVRYGSGGVRGDTSRRTHSRSNPAGATRATSGSIRQGHSPGAGGDPRYGYPLETEAEAPAPANTPGQAQPGASGGEPAAASMPAVPPVGSSISELPEEHIELRVKGQRYRYHLGLFYRPRFSYGSVEYVRVDSPVGAILDEAPPLARAVTVGNTTYREYADTWYEPIKRRGRDNWIVVRPPIKD